MNAHTVETVNINRVSWTLARGCHTPDSLKCCLLEVASLKAGELFGDKPGCVSPVLAAFGRALWDSTPDDQPLSELLPFADRLIGTAGRRDLDQVAGLMSADWAIRRFPVPWLRLAGLGSHADALETLPPLSTWDLVESAAGTTAAARDAAQDAARTAAWAAARTAAWDAAQAAAQTATMPTSAVLRSEAIDLFDRMIQFWEVW